MAVKEESLRDTHIKKKKKKINKNKKKNKKKNNLWMRTNHMFTILKLHYNTQSRLILD